MAIFEKGSASCADILAERDRAELQEAKLKADASQEFERLHDEGAQRFGVLWLTCNMAVSHFRKLPFLPQQDKRIDALISAFAWHLAEVRQGVSQLLVLTHEESTFVEVVRSASDQYTPFTKAEIVHLINIIDRLTGAK